MIIGSPRAREWWFFRLSRIVFQNIIGLIRLSKDDLLSLLFSCFKLGQFVGVSFKNFSNNSICALLQESLLWILPYSFMNNIWRFLQEFPQISTVYWTIVEEIPRKLLWVNNKRNFGKIPRGTLDEIPKKPLDLFSLESPQKASAEIGKHTKISEDSQGRNPGKNSNLRKKIKKYQEKMAWQILKKSCQKSWEAPARGIFKEILEKNSEFLENLVAVFLD